MGAADSYQPFLAALCLWREARGQSDDAKRAVLHVILNRAATGFRGSDPASVILWPYQFSSFNPKDPNAARLPDRRNVGDWRAWLACCAVVDVPGDDPTGGALMYESASFAMRPDWATAEKQTAEIGPFRFYRA
jgi:spore germination cell wall hydrolase CwlJ-like protein